MGRIKEILQAYRTELASVIRNEYKAVFTDGGVLLVMVLWGTMGCGKTEEPESGHMVDGPGMMYTPEDQTPFQGTWQSRDGSIVMEVETGEILAMANLGRSGSSGGSYYERENYALGRSMEPGSPFKLATMLTLLDDAGMSPETTYDTHNGDPVTVGPARNIRDSHRGDHVIGFRRAVASSSNVYFAKAIWDRYGITGKKQEYSDFLHEKLHLGKTVGLERLGERAPSITADWKVPDPGVMLVKMSYGYRVRLAPIR